MDVGCAFGRNIAAAHRELMATTNRDDRVTIIAADCDDTHLDAVRGLGLRGVVTVRCRLPDELPADIGQGSVSGILLSEVAHFLREDELNASLRWMHGALEDGGRLFITAGSYLCNLLGPSCPVGRVAREMRAAGSSARGIDVRALVSADAALAAEWERNFTPVDAAPRHLVWYGPELAQACRDAGFFVVECKFQFREGYSDRFRHDGRECVHVHCVKIDGKKQHCLKTL